MTREEAINEIKSWDFLNEKESEAVRTLIPELRESEDERIRRRMVEHFKSKTKETWCSIPVKDILKWLEKQKVLTEHNEGIYYYHRDGTFTFISSPAVENPHNFTVPKPNEKPVDDDPLNDPRFIDGFDTGREVQKIFDEPAEWSEEDEKFFELLHAALYQIKVRIGKDEYDRAVARLKSLRPQPKAEWSEEDERMARFYANDYDNNLGNMPMCDVIENRIKFKGWLLNKLKSLRPQPHWKPSEEQMKALEIAFRKDGDDNYRNAINSLYNDLKKL